MNFTIIVAAGKGRRINKGMNKVLLPLLGKPMIYYTIKTFQGCNLIDGIIIVTQKNDFKKINEIKNQFNFSKIKNIVEGGRERQDSVYNGLMSIKHGKNNDIIVIHNGSNPLVKETEIVECINAARKYGAAAVGFPLKDTIKKINDDFVEKSLERKGVYQIQTPQAIKYKLFLDAFKNAKNKNLKVTDDASIVEAFGKKVRVVPCSYENIKATTKDDLVIAEGILMRRSNTNLKMRVGFGQDSHKFSEDKTKKLILGGLIIPKEAGLEANSDGDVILHALFNAISTAIGERSLGYYSDPMCKKGVINSKEYLKVILNKLIRENLKINNVSIMIEAKKPKLEEYTEPIKDSLSKILKLSKESIGIAYTSGEELTEFGKGNGIQCFVVVTLGN